MLVHWHMHHQASCQIWRMAQSFQVGRGSSGRGVSGNDNQVLQRGGGDGVCAVTRQSWVCIIPDVILNTPRKGRGSAREHAGQRYKQQQLEYEGNTAAV
jgi:hypothetical protein